MHNAADPEDEDSDPLALPTEPILILEYDDKEEANNESACLKSRPLRRSKRIKDAVVEEPSEDLNAAEPKIEPLFPITKKMKDRIKRMKQRMLATLKLSEEKLLERRRKRAQQARESRQRAANANADYRRREADKKSARTKAQRDMETPEQTAVRMAKKREEGRRYLVKRKQSETAEEKAARREYHRVYSQNRKPIQFV